MDWSSFERKGRRVKTVPLLKSTQSFLSLSARYNVQYLKTLKNRGQNSQGKIRLLSARNAPCNGVFKDYPVQISGKTSKDYVTRGSKQSQSSGGIRFLLGAETSLEMESLITIAPIIMMIGACGLVRGGKNERGRRGREGREGRG